MTTDLYSREAEEAVLGAILIDPDSFHEVDLRTDDFYVHRNRWIWEAFTRLHERRAPIDLLTVVEELERAGHLAEVGGAAYLTALLNQTPTSLHIETYGRLVREHAVRRALVQAANAIAEQAHDCNKDLAEVAAEAVKRLEEALSREKAQIALPLRAVLSDVYDMLERQTRAHGLPGVASGLPDLDALLGNFRPGLFYVVAARPGQGKTSLLLTIARQAAMRGKRVYFFSLEMPASALATRLIAQHTGLNAQLLDTGRIGEEEFNKVLAAIADMEFWTLYLDDSPALTPVQLRALVRRLSLRAAPDLVIVDYLQLLRPGIRAENRTQEVGYLSRSLKGLALDLKAPILAAAQLNRQVEQRASKRPQLSDLRESGDIEADADVVMLLAEAEEKAAGQWQAVDLIVAKNRQGPTGIIPCLFQKSTTLFACKARP